MDTRAAKLSKGSGFWLGQGLALAFVAACLGRVATEAGYLFLTNKIAAAVSLEDSLGPTLTWQLAVFGMKLLLVHSLVGLLAFALARLTEVAFPNVALARRGWLVTGWFVVLAGLALAANTTWHPSSVFAGEASLWRHPIAGVMPVQVAGTLLLALVALLAFRARSHFRAPRPTHAIVVGAALLALVTVALPVQLLDASTPPPPDRPHVVIVGIDSLRNDFRIPKRGEAKTPHIDAFLARARRFSDATTPLARTYPSWMSILTGRHPVATNARYNLMPRRLVHEGETLATALRRNGYRAVYATDEVRFANIDESFGFDQRITPPIGAQDFLLGFTGDIPLVNLVAATPLGARVFPTNHANRAAYVTYRPEHFVDRLDRELEVEGPTFLAVHLTLAHWPYTWAGRPVPEPYDGYRTAYGEAVAAVDRQFDRVMALLEDKGLLDNAVVVLLSDHGEALGAEDDTMLRKTGTSDEIWESLWGHGTSVMSPHQYRVLLALRDYGAARLPGAPGTYDWPVSVEDVRPTLEEFATGLAPANVDGLSLLPFLADPRQAEALAARVRFTETDFNTPSTARGRYEASGVIEEAAFYYELDHATGWVQLRDDRLAELMRVKQRAAISRDALLAAMPNGSGDAVSYLFTSRHDPLPRRLAGPPDPRREPEAARLWAALQARFPGELPDPS